MKKTTPKRIKISVYLDEKQLNALRPLSKATGIPMAHLIRMAIDQINGIKRLAPGQTQAELNALTKENARSRREWQEWFDDLPRDQRRELREQDQNIDPH